jgi:hypothetical protein
MDRIGSANERFVAPCLGLPGMLMALGFYTTLFGSIETPRLIK